MAASYRDITGPVTCLSLFTVKPGYEEAVARQMADDVAEQLRLAETGQLPGLLGIECVWHGDTFASWEKYADADAVERVVPVRYMAFKSHPLAESFCGILDSGGVSAGFYTLMASSYKDITGPVTVLSTFTLKPEFADEVAQYMADDVANQVRLAREGKITGLVSMEAVRYGNTFASWEKYIDADAVEKVVPVRYMAFKELPIAEGFSEPPNIQFFGTDSLPPPEK